LLTSPRAEPSKEPPEELENKKLRKTSAGGKRRFDGIHGSPDVRKSLVMREFLLFLAFRFQVRDPESGKVQAARVAHASVILHVLALWAFEEQRSVACGAELHAVGIRRAAFRAGHNKILIRSAESAR
jgi:hypothetical protein